MKDYYNTTGVTGEMLEDCIITAREQQARIQEWIKKHPTVVFSREDLRPLFSPAMLTTSIVRSLCNLRDLGIIQVVGKTPGTCGKPIFLYQYIPPPPKQETLV